MTRPAADQDWHVVLACARARIARELLASELAPASLGSITLHDHQRSAVARVRTLLRLTNGALLADVTGLGKTFVALAVAATAERPLIIAPASLLEVWHRAMERARVQASVLSMERLSRSGRCAASEPDLVIIDESHHFRNPCTRRYAAAAAICDRAKILLLSATPLQNRRDDLIAQLALFLGDSATTLGDEGVARFIVRRRGENVALRLPVLRGPHRIELAVANDLLDELLAIPPPLPGSDEGAAGALVAYTLLRQWASSHAALVGGLRRRLARAIALATSLEAGRWPSRDELSAWCCAGDVVQLALPELLAPFGSSSQPIGAMLGAVRAHTDGLHQLLARLREGVDPDPYRAETVDAICASHHPARVLAFSQYAETVQALSRLLMARRPGVAELTARGGRVAGGRISRGAVLAQFAPPVLGSREPPRAERISLLVTTDVLSEGLDLQAASVVIHLDLPWNPARLEQRVGRIRRLGATHDEVFVYGIAPPASAERVLRVENRLRTKLGIASHVVGADTPIEVSDERSPTAARPELASEILDMISSWLIAADSDDTNATLYAAVRAPDDGVLALVTAGDDRLLIGAIGATAITADPAVVARVVALCAGPPLPVDRTWLTDALQQVGSWSARSSSRERLALIGPAGSKVRARIAARIAELLGAAPRHQHTAVANLGSRARHALALPLGAGAERQLAALAEAPQADASWLDKVATFAEGRNRAFLVRTPVPRVVILLRRDSSRTSEPASRGA